MKNIISILLLITLMVSSINAQKLTKNGTPVNKRYGLSVGYFGYKIDNPGFQVGVEKYIATTKNYHVISAVNLAYYYQKDVQSAIAVSARIGQRYTTNFGLFFETYLGLGVQQTSYVSKTLEYNAGLSKISETKKSKTGVAPNIALGLGYDFTKKTNVPTKFYLRPAFYWLAPDRNFIFQSSYTIETGAIFVF